MRDGKWPQRKTLRGFLDTLRLESRDTDGHSHPYHLDGSILILGSSGAIFRFYFIFR